MAKRPDDEVLEILVLGKTGSGKSSTANSILGRPAFVTSYDVMAETWFAQAAYTRYEDRVVRVTDSPGLYDNRVGRGAGTQNVVTELSKAVVNCSEGFHVMLLVLKFGCRFTEEDHRVVSALQSVFGKDFLQQFCVLVFTHGEQLEMENEFNETDLTFDEWIANQRGELLKLVTECENRCVLFSNKKKKTMDEQRQQLFREVDRVREKGQRYSSSLFDAAKAERDKLLAKKSATVLRKRLQQKICLLQDTLNWLIGFMSKNKNEPFLEEQLHQLFEDVKSLREEILAEDKGSGVLWSLLQTVDGLERTIENEVGRLAAPEANVKESFATAIDKLESERIPHTAPADAFTHLLHMVSKLMETRLVSTNDFTLDL